eukprot:CAMPEP_0169364362 /NCGR_PEP_ID=MMETSP1017-20121227/31964_1 /TAXON_ID=342587 /ORGANISM="Karlodinium micrum, Strain CCMP2283" /LENGTH=267 /DNA_ID=CAMNT_0009462069 /DNA_START=44 /DNA_END=847 /DNA_ORIENTATION=+
MSKVVVLDDGDDERSPTEDEVIEYAQFLDIDPETEPHLLWIAREGVVAPIPPPWKACTESGDDVFYFNFETGESVWDHPSDEKYQKMVKDEREKHKVALEKKLPTAAGLDEDRKRLELITNEISDEESLSPKSHASPHSNSQASPSRGDSIQPVSLLNESIASESPAKANPTTGSAGVGLAPAVNLSIDSVEDAKDQDGQKNVAASSNLDFSLSEDEPKLGYKRLSKLQDELASLVRVLGKFREIRGQQREFLDLLQVEPSGPSTKS